MKEELSQKTKCKLFLSWDYGVGKIIIRGGGVVTWGRHDVGAGICVLGSGLPPSWGVNFRQNCQTSSSLSVSGMGQRLTRSVVLNSSLQNPLFK